MVPSLVTGYCYRDTSMSLVHYPWCREFLYALIIVLQSVPIAVVLLSFSPAPEVSESGMFVAQRSTLSLLLRWKLLLKSHFRFTVAAFSLLFMTAFQEADLAALMQAKGWTEWMFTKHVGGLGLNQTILLALWPISFQVPCLIPFIFWLNQTNDNASRELLRETGQSRWKFVFCCGWIVSAWVCVVVVPGVQLIRGIGIGFGNLFQQPSLPREIGDSVLLAVTSGTGAVLLSVLLLRLMHSGRFRRVRFPVVGLCLLPCAMGNLALGLVLSGLFQTSWLSFAYDTPIPLILGEVAVILPRALILLHCLLQLSEPSSKYVIGILKFAREPQQRRAARELAWQTHGRRWFGMWCIVMFWAYFEVMLPSILAMPGFAPVGVVLYNNLHYGRIAALGAKLSLTLLLPLLMIFILLQLRRLIVRWI